MDDQQLRDAINERVMDLYGHRSYSPHREEGVKAATDAAVAVVREAGALFLSPPEQRRVVKLLRADGRSGSVVLADRIENEGKA